MHFSLRLYDGETFTLSKRASAPSDESMWRQAIRSPYRQVDESLWAESPRNAAQTPSCARRSVNWSAMAWKRRYRSYR